MFTVGGSALKLILNYIVILFIPSNVDYRNSRGFARFTLKRVAILKN